MTRKTQKRKLGIRMNNYTKSKKYGLHSGGGSIKQSISNSKTKCSPAVDELKVGSSCYTPQILTHIRDEYNKSNPTTKITETNPAAIWIQLHEKLDHCNTEKCWLNEIKDEKMRKQIDRYVFAPHKPPEWNDDPNAWLGTYDILNVLEQYEHARKDFSFIGPTAIDFDTKPNGIVGQCINNELCNFNLAKELERGKEQFGIVFNTDTYGSPGEHWIAMYIDIPNKFIYYFDSENSKTPPEINTLAHRIQKQAHELGIKLKYLRNHKRHQYGLSECGMYCLFFIVTMLTGKIDGKEVSLKNRLKLFTKQRIPDKEVFKYRNVYFSGGGH